MTKSTEKVPGLTECISGLENAANVLTTELRLQQDEQTAVRALMPSEIKTELFTAINDQLIPLLTAAAITDPAKFQSEANEVEGIVTIYNKQMRERHAKVQKKEEQ